MKTMRRSLAGVLVAVTLTAVAIPAAATPETRPPATVYVGENGSSYHRADCPRVRFSRPLPREVAERSYRPCRVCMPDLAAAPAGVAAPGVAAPAAVRARSSTQARATRDGSQPRRGRRGLGLASRVLAGALVGGGGGFAIGAASGDRGWRTVTGAVFGVIGAGMGALVGACLPGKSEEAESDLTQAAGTPTGPEIRIAPEAIAAQLGWPGRTPTPTDAAALQAPSSSRPEAR